MIAALFGQDWIHQASCISSSFYQVLIYWYGKSVVVYPADSQSFETNMIQSNYYDENIGYIMLQGFNANEAADKEIYLKSHQG